MPPTLYHPEFEHDACGIGFVARTTGHPGHDIVELALEALGCMEHRSGIDADGLSGDGAGILTHIPHRLLSDEIADLPGPGDYALGMFFFSADIAATAKGIIENILSQTFYAQEVVDAAVDKAQPISSNGTGKKSKIQNRKSKITWRDVPVNVDVLGQTARRTCPVIKQAIIYRPAHIARGDEFERLLYTARRRLDASWPGGCCAGRAY